MRIFSGIRPSSDRLHLGNYLGAVQQWVKMQEEHDCIFSIADLHAITTPYDKDDLQNATREVFASYLSLGVNPEKATIFVQSHVQELTELTWLLSTVTPVGKLKRMIQFKEKSKKHRGHVNAGLLNYPILMASDILLYKTEGVPVGEDQTQHVELTRDIAKKFNRRYGETFPIPESLTQKKGGKKIMSLTHPKNKMSKSDSDKSQISPFEDPGIIKKKIMSAQTDTGSEVKYDPESKPGISNLLTIYSLFSELSTEQIEDNFDSGNYKKFKEGLAGLLVKKLKPFREKKKKIDKNPEILDEKIKKGKEKASDIAKKNMKEIKSRMGF